MFSIYVFSKKDERTFFSIFSATSPEGSQQAEANTTDDATPGPSSSQTTAEQIRQELESLGMPEGVDPSFLAALPDNIR